MTHGFSAISWQKCHRLLWAWGLGIAVAGDIAAAAALEIRIENADCRWLARHAGDAATYEPGVDVRGNPVPPADLSESPAVPAPESIPIRIRVDLQERFAIPADPELFDPQAEIGFVTVKDGTAYLNGVPLSDPDRAAVSDACRERAEKD